MKSALIGYTGFVGGNLKNQFNFTDKYNSSNISEIKSKEYDIIVCAGIPASMWMANNFPEKDLENIEKLLSTLKTVKTKKFVLISSVAVFKQPVKNVNEDSKNFEDNLAYGKHRRYAEEVIINNFKNSLIVRLPALFGDGLKKNLLYDILNQEPAFMPDKKFKEVLEALDDNEKNFLKEYYDFDDAKSIWTFNKEKAKHDNDRTDIVSVFQKTNFTSLNFTNSESIFQFYDLNDLWKDINIALENNLPTLHLCSEPIKTKEIIKRFCHFNFDNDNGQPPFDYNLKTKYSTLWKKTRDYQYDKNEMLSKIGKFIEKNI